MYDTGAESTQASMAFTIDAGRYTGVYMTMPTLALKTELDSYLKAAMTSASVPTESDPVLIAVSMSNDKGQSYRILRGRGAFIDHAIAYVKEMSEKTDAKKVAEGHVDGDGSEAEDVSKGSAPVV